MKLQLVGHQELYPVEQLQMQLFPEEPSEYTAVPFSGENGAVSSLHEGARYLTASAKITCGGKTARAQKRLLKSAADVRGVRRILQQSYYLAAVKLLDAPPPWGALSGVRPSKLSSKILLAGGTERAADALLRDAYFVSPARRRLCLDCSRETVKAAKLLRKTDLSLYIGIPFCPTRCAYCSFVSQSIEKHAALLPRYLDALLREIEYTGKLLADSPFGIRTLYIGGGTPSVLSAAQMKTLLTAIQSSFDLSACLEFTVEGGRPDTLDAEKLAVIRRGGCTRISINPQTMSDAVLAAIGRRHTAKETLRAFGDARKAGFSCINMDLIAGLPQDSVEGFAASVDALLALSPENITVHTLALKKAAALWCERLSLPDAKAVGRMLSLAEARLRQNGYLPYYLYRQKFMSGSFENVGWTKAGYSGLYNIYMMEELHTILSLGGGGMNKINLPEGQLERFHNPKDPQSYLARIEQILAQKDEIFEILTQQLK